MCGLCGVVRPRGVEASDLRPMLASLVHRGPDDEGLHVEAGAGLGHRRLSIIDLGGGHQPIANEDETVWIVLNGEIYNYRELRDDLLARGHRFRTESDTEVIVHLYEEYGRACVEKLRGMFAITWARNRSFTHSAGKNSSSPRRSRRSWPSTARSRSPTPRPSTSTSHCG
jgi:asparagine synthase (glutamine-hydrolysing)